jgi:MbtH protein
MNDQARASGPADLYFVVRNDEDQYSIWRSDKPLPLGWASVGAPAAREDCLDRIKLLWADMRPASLRGG